MISFNPKKFFLNKIEEVEVCLESNGKIKAAPMIKKENGTFIYESNLPYTNYYFRANGRTYCSHKLEYAVISTMSSGKSTFINALIGKDIMPSENQACTGKIFKLETLFGNQKDTMCIKKDGKIKRYFLEEEILKTLNLDSSIDEINIQVKYSNIRNNISIYDTPGVNSYQNKGHKDITYNFLEKSKIKNFIYILNATQIGTYDDKFFLLDLEELKNRKDIKILFILNKIDLIDEEKENKEEIIENVKNYLEKNNFQNYLIFPLSAYLVKLIRKALNGLNLTRVEKINLKKYYDNSLVKEKIEDEYIEFKEFSLSKNKLENMLKESGILDIEDTIQNINVFYPTFSLRII